ncbi:MAG: GGDEF domain-containing protein [Campylobacterota bacterium]|nr:GGDEF domain-containing protein [Campylobacterota bacterium]
MLKNELISLTDKMCKELLLIIEKQKITTKDDIANYLIKSAQVVMNVDKDKINTEGYADLLFSDAYKDIALKSLSSYSDTSKNIERLNKMHENTREECNKKDLDLSELTNKFNKIQTQMNDVIRKANDDILQLTSQIDVLQERSTIDSLTNIFNRRALSTYLDEVCSKKNIPENMHILLLDIDDFKNINDSYGHIAGDKILIFIAHILKKTLRDGDKVFRFGGEEFLIVLNRLNQQTCKAIINRLLSLIRGNSLIYKGDTLNVTMSVGATMLTQNDTPDSVIERADKALYKAKTNGKDQMHMEVE